MVTDMNTDEIDNNFQMVTSSDGDINERANEAHFLFSYQCRSENYNSASTKFELDLIPTSTSIQPHFNLKLKSTSASISTQPQLNMAVT